MLLSDDEEGGGGGGAGFGGGGGAGDFPLPLATAPGEELEFEADEEAAAAAAEAPAHLSDLDELGAQDEAGLRAMLRELEAGAAGEGARAGAPEDDDDNAIEWAPGAILD